MQDGFVPARFQGDANGGGLFWFHGRTLAYCLGGANTFFAAYALQPQQKPNPQTRRLEPAACFRHCGHGQSVARAAPGVHNEGMATFRSKTIRCMILATAMLGLPCRDALPQDEIAPSAWTSVAQAAIPMVLVESGESYQWKSPSEDGDTQSISIQTDHLALIRRFWHGDSFASRLSRGPVVRITIDWDRTTGTYALRRVALGFLRKRIWLAHDISDTEDRHGTLSIQISKEW